MEQTKNALNIFEERFPGAIGLFAFDNATTHQKRADDALSARYMPKNPGWNSQNAPKNCMRSARLPDGSPQSLYFSSDHPTYPGQFKGMAQILTERNIDIRGKLSQCTNFKCADLNASCCCRRILFNQPDFQEQKSALQEYIESRGHKAIFYPKYHCELNFIEQCWGRAKYYYRMLPRTSNEKEMEENVISSLDSIPLELFRK